MDTSQPQNLEEILTQHLQVSNADAQNITSISYVLTMSNLGELSNNILKTIIYQYNHSHAIYNQITVIQKQHTIILCN